MVLSQTGNVNVETSGQFGETHSINLWRNAERMLVNFYIWRGVGTENDGDDDDDHEELNSKARRFCQETQIKWGGKKAAIPTYKIYKKGEFG